MNSYITAGHKEKLILLPGYTDITVEIEKLGLPSLKISDLFLTEKLSQSSPVQRTIDPISVPTPPTSPPGLVHPSSIAKSTIGTYKAAVQSKVLTGSDDGYTRPTLSAIRASGDWRQVDYSDDEIMGVNGRGLRKTNPRLVEFLIIRYGSQTDGRRVFVQRCSPSRNVSRFFRSHFVNY